MSTKRNPNAAPCRLINNKYLCWVIIFFLANYLVLVKRKISYVKSVYRTLIPSMLAFKTSFPGILHVHWLPLCRERKACR